MIKDIFIIHAFKIGWQVLHLVLISLHQIVKIAVIVMIVKSPTSEANDQFRLLTFQNETINILRSQNYYHPNFSLQYEINSN